MFYAVYSRYHTCTVRHPGYSATAKYPQRIFCHPTHSAVAHGAGSAHPYAEAANAPLQKISYSRLQIGWGKILRLFLKKNQRTRILHAAWDLRLVPGNKWY